MSFNQRSAIKEAYEELRPRLPEFSKAYYGNLFSAKPEFRALFKPDLTDQRIKFVLFLNQLIGLLDRLDEALPACRALGQRHVDYGVRPEYYEDVGAALILTLEQMLGDRWTPEMHDAWAELYRVVSKAMIDAQRAHAA